MTRREAEDLVSKLRHIGKEGLFGFINEVVGDKQLRRGFGRAGEKFLENKRAFDQNIETVLDFVNVPSKKDVRELKARLDHLSSQILNLNIKLDRLMVKEPHPGTGAKIKLARGRRNTKPAS